MSLPTYQEASRRPSRRDALQLVSKYVADCSDLFSCCLVSKEWCDIFSDILWENPLPKITSQASFAKFYGIMPFCTAATKVRVLDSRQWYCDPRNLAGRSCLGDDVNRFRTRTRDRGLAVVNGEEEARDSSTPETVQAAVHRLATSHMLPNAQFLILDSAANPESPAFDIMDLWESRPLLLSLERVHLALNGLVELGQVQLPFFDRVRYLSLSKSLWQTSASIRTPLNIFGIFSNVAVLKLRNCGLVDRDLTMLRMHQLAPDQLTCLDLRDNHLTDECIKDLNELLMHFEPECYEIYPYKIHNTIEASPQYRPVAADPEYHQIYHQPDRDIETIPDDVDEFIAWARARGNLETMPNTGLRQLYLSGNNLTYRTLMFVLAMTRGSLCTIHCDVSPTGLPTQGAWTAYFPAAYQRTSMLDGSPIPLAVALCSHHHAPKLERLTIHHSFVTFSPKQRHIDAPLGPGEHTPYGTVASPNEQHRFLPEVNNNIQYLELTGVPAFGSEKLLGDLEHFIRRAAQIEHDLIVARQTRPLSRRAPRILPGLKKLVVVLTNKSEDKLSSVTEDQDAEQFMRESEEDFSFFEEEKGRGNMSIADQKVERQRSQLVDIRAGLAAFRKGTREAYEEVKRVKGSWQADYFAEPHYHWGGDVVVVRPSG